MARPKGSKTNYFSKVLQAREALADKAMEIYEAHMTLVREAIKDKQFKAAGEHLRWLGEHIIDSEGNRMVGSSVDMPAELHGPQAPTIQIGIALNSTPELPPAPIEDQVNPIDALDVKVLPPKPEEDDDTDSDD